jgi:hypothetical protein
MHNASQSLHDYLKHDLLWMRVYVPPVVAKVAELVDVDYMPAELVADRGGVVCRDQGRAAIVEDLLPHCRVAPRRAAGMNNFEIRFAVNHKP